MNFTNIISVGKVVNWNIVWGEAKWQVKKQVDDAVDDQVLWKVYDQITQIKYKIKQELNK